VCFILFSFFSVGAQLPTGGGQAQQGSMERVQLSVKCGAFMNPAEFLLSRDTLLGFVLLFHHTEVAGYLRSVGGLPFTGVKVVAHTHGGCEVFVTGFMTPSVCVRSRSSCGGAAEFNRDYTAFFSSGSGGGSDSGMSTSEQVHGPGVSPVRSQSPALPPLAQVRVDPKDTRQWQWDVAGHALPRPALARCSLGAEPVVR
jgi:hypothetical protein